MKFLVTGSAGFIGYHVCRRLLAGGHTVVGVDNFNSYYDVSLKRMRAGLLLALPGFTQQELDLAEAQPAENLFKQTRPEQVIHLAAQAGVRYSVNHPHAYSRSNLEAFLNILEGCRHQGVRRLTYASSSSVYGGITELPFREDMDVSRPISLYAATKKANELMAHSYSHLYGFESVGVRFFTVYGPFGRPDMAIWLFTEAILADRKIQIFNHGKMRRDFTFVEDIVSGVVAATQARLPSPCEVYNLGNHVAEDLERLISLLEHELGRKARREYLPLQAGDVPETYADIAKARRELGFAPSTRLEEGIPRFVKWYREVWLPSKENA